MATLEGWIHELTGVESSWLEAVGYASTEDSGLGLVVDFGGTEIFYPRTRESMYFDLLNTSSPGGYVWDNLYHRKYETLD